MRCAWENDFASSSWGFKEVFVGEVEKMFV